MKFIVGLSSIALFSLSSVSPCLAVNQSISRSSDRSLSNQSLPIGAKAIQVAGIFDIVEKALDIVDSERQRDEKRAAQKREEQERLERKVEAERVEQKRIAEEAQRQQLEQKAERQQREEKASQPVAFPGQNSPQNTNQPFPQALNKKSNETHEQWYARTRPIILYMKGTDYRAWKATLSAQDTKAFDAITKRKNNEALSGLNGMIPGILESVIEEIFVTPTQQGCQGGEYYPDGTRRCF